MNEVKLVSYSAMLEQAKSAGIKESKLEKAIENHSLPKSGRFVKVEVIGGEFPHILLHTNTGHKMSISRLISTASLETSKAKVKFRPSTNATKVDSFGKYFLDGTRLNPVLSTNQAKTAYQLQNMEFEAEPVKGYVLPFEADATGKPIFCATADEAREKVVVKDFYSLTLKGELPEITEE